MWNHEDIINCLLQNGAMLKDQSSGQWIFKLSEHIKLESICDVTNSYVLDIEDPDYTRQTFITSDYEMACYFNSKRRTVIFTKDVYKLSKMLELELEGLGLR